MAMARSTTICSQPSLHRFHLHSPSQAHIHLPRVPNLRHPSMQVAEFNRRVYRKLHASKEDNIQRTAPDPEPKKPPAPIWITGIFWSALYLILPISRLKEGKVPEVPVGPLAQVETVVETVEIVSEVVEDAAEAVEAVSSVAESRLPDKDKKLKKTLSVVESISKKVAEDAEKIVDISEKVEELTEGPKELIESVAEEELKKGAKKLLKVAVDKLKRGKEKDPPKQAN